MMLDQSDIVSYAPWPDERRKKLCSTDLNMREVIASGATREYDTRHARGLLLNEAKGNAP